MLFSSEVLALSIPKPAEASYAIVSMQLLPVGLTGVIVVAILTATMSSMDTGLNNNVAIMIKDIYPALCKWFKWKQKDDTALLRYSRFYTLLLGIAIILLALYFSKGDGKGIFDIMLDIGVLLLTPMVVPWTAWAIRIGTLLRVMTASLSRLSALTLNGSPAVKISGVPS